MEKTAGAMKWTVLCPNWFMSNHLGDIFATLPMGIIAYPLEPEAKAAIIDPRDVGDLDAKLMSAPDPSVFHGLKLDVSGPEKISVSEIAALYSESLGRPVTAVKPSVDEWIGAAVGGGFEEWLARAVSLNFLHWEAGDLSFPTSPEALALSPPKRTMGSWIKEWSPRSPPAAA